MLGLDIDHKRDPQGYTKLWGISGGAGSMAYGRIDVYWPDGPIESYQLEKPSIAIGRSSGNDIVLDTTAVSRYHVSLSRQDQQVLLEDLGCEVDQYRIEIDGVPKEWVRMDRAQFEIDPGGDVPVLISFKPLRRSESAPGDYAVTVRVHAQSVPDQPTEARMHLMVRAYSGFGIVLGTERITPDDPFELHVHNQGSGPLTLTLAGAAPGGGLVFDLPSPSLTLAPGERRAIH